MGCAWSSGRGRLSGWSCGAGRWACENDDGGKVAGSRHGVDGERADVRFDPAAVPPS